MSTVTPEEFRRWLEGQKVRTARVSTRNADAEVIARYLPSNYQVVEVPALDNPYGDIVIAGVDIAGWTLDGYVIPRLASGLIHAEEES